jgi:hypothetical protein
MRLSSQEFKAMNNTVRRFVQRTVEFPIFNSLGLTGEHWDILEIGCGSGYGAVLLSTLHPKKAVAQKSLCLPVSPQEQAERPSSCPRKRPMLCMGGIQRPFWIPAPRLRGDKLSRREA